MQNRFILLVEDDANDEALTLRAWQKQSIRRAVVVARDGAEALDFLFGTGKYAGRDVREQPELVLLDLNLPKLSGIQVLARIRADQRTRLLPVVMLTSSIQEGDVQASYTNGCNGYVRKCVDFLEFTNLVRDLAAYWLSRNVSLPQASLSHS